MGQRCPRQRKYIGHAAGLIDLVWRGGRRSSSKARKRPRPFSRGNDSHGLWDHALGTSSPARTECCPLDLRHGNLATRRRGAVTIPLCGRPAAIGLFADLHRPERNQSPIRSAKFAVPVELELDQDSVRDGRADAVERRRESSLAAGAQPGVDIRFSPQHDDGRHHRDQAHREQSD